jgi:hypothetical protein
MVMRKRLMRRRRVSALYEDQYCTQCQQRKHNHLCDLDMCLGCCGTQTDDPYTLHNHTDLKQKYHHQQHKNKRLVIPQQQPPVATTANTTTTTTTFHPVPVSTVLMANIQQQSHPNNKMVCTFLTLWQLEQYLPTLIKNRFNTLPVKIFHCFL